MEGDNHVFRTDLAIEAKEFLAPDPQQQIPGVESDTKEMDGISISRVSIRTPQAERVMNKAMGNYVNIEAPGLREKDTDLQERVSQVVARELQNIAKFSDKVELLVVGLGNWNVTPDAIGPRVVEDLVITRHLLKFVPEKLGPGFRSMAGGCSRSPRNNGNGNW